MSSIEAGATGGAEVPGAGVSADTSAPVAVAASADATDAEASASEATKVAAATAETKPSAEAADEPMKDAGITDPASAVKDVPAVAATDTAEAVVAAPAVDSSDGAAAGATEAVISEPLVGDVALGSVDLTDDTVPMVSYDDKRCQFSKEGRYILPKREQFPSIFCALRVKVRLEAMQGPTGRSPAELSSVDIEELLCEELGFGGSTAHWEDVRTPSATNDGSARDILVALSAALPPGREIGSVLQVERMGIAASTLETVETSDDVDPDRITSVSNCFKDAGDGADAIALELPQVWIILDPDFKAKSPSIGLYPGSYWMGFLKCWGMVTHAEIFFRTVQHKSNEPLIHLVVQFKDRELLKLCYTFLHDRYLAHPKLEHGVRPPACQLIRFQDFKAKAVAAAAAAKPNPDSAKGPARTVRGKAGVAKGSAKTPKAAGTPVQQGRVLAKAAPGTAAAKAASAAVAAGGTPMTPAHAKAPIVKANPKARRPENAATAPDTPRPAAEPDDDRQLSTADVMDQLSGRQLEVFQMVMTRMERLEKENQELMQILLQMQGLLQQQQQRNARLNQAPGGQPAVPQGPGQLPNMLPGFAPMLPGAAGLHAPMMQPHAPMPMQSFAPAPNGGMRVWRQVPEGGAKRKADPLDPEQAAYQQAAAEGDENAPWKGQRRRFKRPRIASGAPAPPASQFPPQPPPAAATLAAYQDALLD